MRFAVCDDDQKFCLSIKGFLEDYEDKRKISLETDLYHDGKSISDAMTFGKIYDLIFLDVYLPKSNGLTVGNYIRHELKDYQTGIIFLSNEEDHLEDLFKVHPFCFLKKPLTKKTLTRTIDEFRLTLFGEHKSFYYQKNKFLHQLPFDEIVYFQSEGRKIHIHTINSVYDYNGKLSDIIAKGIPENFIPTHKSFIVNSDFVSKIDPDQVQIRIDKKWIPISCSHKRSVKEAFDDIDFTPRG